MRLLENEAKEIFGQHGISIPRGVVARTVDDAVAFYASLGSEAVVKPLGIKGRGKAGLIAFVKNANELANAAQKFFGMDVNGEKITQILVEEKVDIAKEFYIAVTIDYAASTPVVVLSSQGGVDIEDVAKKSPRKVKKMPVDITVGINAAVLEKMASETFGEKADELVAIIDNLYSIFRKYDAETAEINPLVVTKRGELIAVDAVLNVNDDSLSRHPGLAKLDKERKYRSEFERQMGELGWSYIDMDGNIGIISSGAGLSMATLDLIQQHGGKPANFLDMAQVDGEGIYKAFDILTRKPNVKAILINLFAGLNRCDDMASGVKRFLSERKVSVPIVVRMVGNREDEGVQILKEVGLENVPELEKAVEIVVEASR